MVRALTALTVTSEIHRQKILTCSFPRNALLYRGRRNVVAIGSAPHTLGLSSLHGGGLRLGNLGPVVDALPYHDWCIGRDRDRRHGCGQILLSRRGGRGRRWRRVSCLGRVLNGRGQGHHRRRGSSAIRLRPASQIAPPNKATKANPAPIQKAPTVRMRPHYITRTHGCRGLTQGGCRSVAGGPSHGTRRPCIREARRDQLLLARGASIGAGNSRVAMKARAG